VEQDGRQLVTQHFFLTWDPSQAWGEQTWQQPCGVMAASWWHITFSSPKILLWHGERVELPAAMWSKMAASWWHSTFSLPEILLWHGERVELPAAM
jgi:hypothetical protein